MPFSLDIGHFSAVVANVTTRIGWHSNILLSYLLKGLLGYTACFVNMALMVFLVTCGWISCEQEQCSTVINDYHSNSPIIMQVYRRSAG